MSNNIVLFMILGIVGIFAAVLVAVAWKFSTRVVCPNTICREESYEKELKNGTLSIDVEEAIVSEDVNILSKYGYSLEGKLFLTEDSNKIVILCHGINSTIFQMYKYRDMYIELGFSVLIYDQRNHGNSGGKNTTYGFYEKYDLLNWVTWLKHRISNDIVIGFHGESMGAAIALQTINIAEVDFCVADSSFSNLETEIIDRFEKKYNFSHKIITELVKIICRLRTGMVFSDVSPVKAVSQSTYNVPIMIVHGMLDNLVPPQMGLDIYEHIKGQVYRQMLAVVDAGHIEAVVRDRYGYLNALKKFLNGCGVR